jgi:hypothetical protein
MADNPSAPHVETHTEGVFGNLTAEERSAFDAFKEQCDREGFLKETISDNGDDMKDGICDDGTLL